MNNTRAPWPPKAPYPTSKVTQSALRMLSSPACNDNVWKGEAIVFDEFEHYYKDLDEDAWKIAWKINYMKRLNSVADAAWTNHLDRMAQEEERHRMAEEEERSCLCFWNGDTNINDHDADLFDVENPPLYR